MKNKNLRMCIICKSHKEKSELYRFVKVDGTIKYDATGKMNCRGYYICKNNNCFEKVQKSKSFNIILKRSITEEEIKEIESCYNNK